MNYNKVIKLTCEINKVIVPIFMKALKELNVNDMFSQEGRSVVLREKSLLFGLSSQTVLDEDPIGIFIFYIPESAEDYVMSYIIHQCDLSLPGRGSIYSEDINIYQEKINFVNDKINMDLKFEKLEVLSDLMGINCIVQRGEGNSIGRTALELGLCVPICTYGIGTGLRDKLGLLRITIPAEKEVVTIVVNKHDADDAMEELIVAGKLDQPGKGFIYQYPVKKGLINSMILRGKMRHAASVEQIIAAIDDIKGNAWWRRRESAQSSKKKKRIYLTNLSSIMISCNQGRTDELVEEAMGVGAGGATIYKIAYMDMSESKEKEAITPARDMGNLIVPPTLSEAILNKMQETGIFDDKTLGVIENVAVPKACTYLAPKK